MPGKVDKPKDPFGHVRQSDFIEAPPIENDTLEAGNHTFDVGKYRSLSVGRRILRVLFGESMAPHRTYTPETFKAALDFLFAHLKPGEKARIAIGNRLSEFCNGPDNVQGFMSFEEEAVFLRSLAAQMGHKDQLEIFDLVGEHTELLAALESAEKDHETGCVVLDSVFKNCPPLTENFDGTPDALQIAHCLYETAKEVPALVEDFRSCIPESARPIDAPLTMMPSDSYALFETAIRLKNILDGQKYQGGILRQNKYIQIVRNLISGGNKYDKHPKLQPLLKVLDGAKYRAFYLKDDTTQNPFARKALTVRRATRASFYGTAAMLGIGATTTYIHNLQEERRVAEIRAEKAEFEAEQQKILQITGGFFVNPSDLPMIDIFGSSECHGLDSWDHHGSWTSFVHNARALDYELEARYSMSPEERVVLSFAVSSDLYGRGVNHTCIMGNRYDRLVDYLDGFIATRQKLLQARRISLSKPYSQLEPYFDLLLSTADRWPLDTSEDIEIDEDEIDENQKFGPFSVPSYSFRETYEIAVVERAGKQLLLARDLTPCEAGVGEQHCFEERLNTDYAWHDSTFSLFAGVNFAADYVVGMQKYDMAPYRMVVDVTNEVIVEKYLAPENARFRDFDGCVENSRVLMDDAYVPDFDSSISSASYALATVNALSMVKPVAYGTFLVAKKPGESCWNIGSAIEFADLYANVQAMEYPR